MDPAKMKVVDLRSELGALGLDTKGNKPALVERLKKALESKTGKAIPDTSILDTSTEADEESTPRRAGPAARTRRRSSSSRIQATPSKIRKQSPEPIEESKDEGNDRYSPQPYSEESNSMSDFAKDKTPERETGNTQEKAPEQPAYGSEDDKSFTPEPVQAPVTDKDDDSQEKSDDTTSEDKESAEQVSSSKMEVEEEKKPDQGDDDKKNDEDKDKPEEKLERKRELTEEEEWEELNERLRIREQERIEREKLQAEEDARKLEELSNNPVKLNRLKRKQEKKARWSNFYNTVAVTNEILTPPNEDDYKIKGKKAKEPVVETKTVEPEIDDSKVTLSWYDSDLNQYMELPDLNGVVPLSDGAFSHAWAGARATHGVTSGRVVYEVRVGSTVTTTESTEKEGVSSGLRIGWSTTDASLHLGEDEFGWGYESTGRFVNNGQFNEYGKALNEKDVIGVYLDLESNPCKMFYTVNGVELGTAYEFDKSVLDDKALFPHVLTKNQCYKVNFGYDRYNMITKTKIVRNRVEIPVEQVLEEKRALEAELQRQKDEAIRREKERKEREKQEREERQRRKKEERERQEKERKEKEAQERRERGEEPEPEAEPEKDAEEKMETADDAAEKQEEEPPKENGEEPKVEPPAEVKTEVMETDQAAEGEDVKAKDEKEPEGEVPEVTEEQVLQGHVLDKRIKFVIRYTVSEELDGVEACMEPGFLHIASASDLVPGPRRPASLADCEVILMVGMPGAGKTYWAKKHIAENPDKRYNLLSTGDLFDKMKVDCKPFRSTYEGRWDAMVSKCAKCVLKLTELARGRRRNFILDQTNVYPSAQRRKLRELEGYRRVAVAVVTDERTYEERRAARDQAHGKEVPDPALVDMKANFTLPEKCAWIDEVIYPELDAEAAKAIVEGFHKEARAAGVVKEKERRDRSAGRDGPQAKRHKGNDKRHGRDDRGRSREFQRDREDRWSSGGSRWGNVGGGGGGRGGGGGAGGGGRWGRDRPAPPPGRFDRWGPPMRGGDFNNRDRDSFRGRGGMGAGGGGRGDRGPAGPGRGPVPPTGDRPPFVRDNRGPRPPPGVMDKRPPQAVGQGGGAGTGSWQRGGQVAGNNRGRGGQHQPRPPHNNQKDGGNQNQQQQQQQQAQGWNQWAGGWGGWGGNWNQNQAAGWGNWGNWGNWNGGQNQQQPAVGGQQQQQAGNNSNNKGQQQQQNWANNYSAQQWYQWQQWQQQQQAWSGYGQGGNQQQPTPQEAQQAWAQYYQNYGNAAAAAAASGNNAVTGAEKKS